MSLVSQLLRFLSLACRAAVGLVFLALIVVVTIQITTRTFDLPSFVWTEELSRYLLLYMVADLEAKGMTFTEVDQAAFAEAARQPVIDAVDEELRPIVERLFAN